MNYDTETFEKLVEQMHTLVSQIESRLSADFDLSELSMSIDTRHEPFRYNFTALVSTSDSGYVFSHGKTLEDSIENLCSQLLTKTNVAEAKRRQAMKLLDEADALRAMLHARES